MPIAKLKKEANGDGASGSYALFRISADWTAMHKLAGKGYLADMIRPEKTWLQQYIQPDDQPHVSKNIQKAIQTKSIFELEHSVLLADGSHRWAFSRAAPLLDETEEIGEWLGATNDVTPRKAADELIVRQEAMYRAIVETSADGFLMVNQKGRVRMVNNAYARRSGYSREELLSMSIADLEARESLRDMQTHIDKIFQTGNDLFETQHRTKYGDTWPAEINASQVAVGESLFVSFVRDLTERRALERKIIETASSEQERLGRELHDNVGQQLAGIGMLASSVLRRLKAGGHNEEADIVADLTQHIQTVIGDVAALSHGLAPVELDAKGLGNALSRLTTKVAETTGIDCQYRNSHTIDVESGSTATHLYRIAQEAIHNAIKHGNPKRIDVSLENVQSHLVLTIRDDGNGIHNIKDQKRGLGLRIMTYRCSTIGGHLSIERLDEGGTVVCCRVPLGH